jgi:hypothetical protein
MESEISLLMANQTLVNFFSAQPYFPYPLFIVPLLQASPGKLLYDPFMGTGSMAYVSRYS